MLTDDAVVVLENIERHLEEHDDLQKAIREGTKEVISPVFAGTVATIAIMFPLMYVGDFPEHIFAPLIKTLIIALLVSYFLSITFRWVLMPMSTLAIQTLNRKPIIKPTLSLRNRVKLLVFMLMDFIPILTIIFQQ